MSASQSTFNQWLETVLSQELSTEIKAFSINLYEHVDSYELELIGAPSFDPDNEDWACNDIFMSDRLEIYKEELSPSWEKALSTVVKWLEDFMASDTGNANTLKSSLGVGVGFVDGNLVLVHPS